MDESEPRKEPEDKVPDEESLAFFENEVERLFLRSAFNVKRKAEFEKEGIKDIVDFLLTTRDKEAIIVECRFVKAESPDYITPLLELLVDKKNRVNANKALVISKVPGKKEEKKEQHEKVSYLRYASQGVYYLCFDDFKRLYDLPETDLRAELRKILNLLPPSEDNPSLTNLSDDESTGLYTGSDIESHKTFDLRSFAVAATILGFVFLLVVALIWNSIEAFFDTIANIMGLVLVMFLIVALGFSEKKK